MNLFRSARQKMAQQISLRLTVSGLLAALSLMVLTTSIQIYVEINSVEKITEGHLERLLLSSKLPAQNAVYTYDFSLAEGIVDSLLLNEFITGVWIFDEEQTLIASGIRTASTTYSIPYLTFLIGDPLRSKELQLAIYEDAPEKFGVLKISYNNHLPYQELLHSSWLRLGLNSLTVALVTFFLITIFSRTLTQPLRRVASQLREIDFNDTGGKRLGTLYSHREDELGTLVEAINTQLGVADELMNQIRQTLEEAESSYQNLNALVESLPHMITVKLKDGTPVLANQAFLKAFGTTSEEFLKQNFNDLLQRSLSPSDLLQMQDADNEALATRKSVLLPEIDWKLTNRHHLATEIRKLYINYQGADAILTVGVDITERKQQQAYIQHLAYHDALTDLPNRHLFIDRLEQALLRSQRSKHHGALIFVDLDNFKVVNDTKGHLAGDAILTEVANRLREDVRDIDTVARLGGDEFVVCMADLGESDKNARDVAIQRANRLLKSLQAPVFFRSEPLVVSASLGLAFFHDYSLNASELLRHADMAMYRAKESGKNRLILFEKEMAETNKRLTELKQDSKRAMREKQFYLVFQPQVDAEMNRIVGAEALLRWRHPKRGTISPAEFIPMLETSDMMTEVGTYVLRETIRQTAIWHQQGILPEPFKMCINVSPQQFRARKFTEVVIECIEQHQIPPHLIDLEITEGMIIDNIEHTVASMNELRDAGIHFSIDDFGTGYSNLNYLKRLPLDVLKVDQSFVRDIQSDPNDSAIVRTIFAMADQLKLNTIAEGVETEEQLNILRAMGCQVFQGYLYSPPVATENFAQLLITQHQSEQKQA